MAAGSSVRNRLMVVDNRYGRGRQLAVRRAGRVHGGDEIRRFQSADEADGGGAAGRARRGVRRPV